MPQDPSRRIEPRAPIQALPQRPVLTLLALCILLALSGCAAIAPVRPPEVPAASEPTPRPESAAAPSEGRAGEAAPRESSALPTLEGPKARILVVKASAYNSHSGQTDSSPSIGAWGDRLAPGMKVIAVSKDLVELGLGRGQRVRIRGLEGEYVVMDRMPSRWHQKIDIYMGLDVRAARNWGVRDVEILWVPDEDVEVGLD